MDCFPAEVDKLGITMYAKDLMPAEHKPSRRAKTYTFHENHETQDQGNYPREILPFYSVSSPRVICSLSNFFPPTCLVSRIRPFLPESVLSLSFRNPLTHSLISVLFPPSFLNPHN